MRLFNLRSAKNQTTLQAIIEGCRKQDSRSQELLFRYFAPRILTTCRRYETPHFGAQDILQETFLTVFNKFHQFDPDKGAIESWMKRIAINTALKVLRKQKLQFVEIDYHPEAASMSATPDVEPNISEEQILSALKELPEGYRTVFNLFVIDGFSHQEIAELLSISPQTSKSQFFKAKRMMRTKLTPLKKTLTNV
ncbi:MAG: sigma-70 family RNA polymerase sigma factor [Bacteroidota bacterium]